ncbi:tubulin nucleotide-binding domain-like protein [Trichoderma longibrachiatum]|uniref:Tubulin nucleotide-binding domain-like protein n=1 Tax=Trichoderma longibrachiatum ATCC 18648 TaxID=983965 RepID=A0A2T4C1L4_TRILO|nr:tubulin nucleotide-binding domain-like protein [Trichoderma longibrachiatum ATCC 18648]
MREIVTLQLGNLSNYVATHFWNAQESYFTYAEDETSLVDHNIHWRPGLGEDGSETFLPRAVVYDLKGGFGPLKKVNPMYDAAQGQDASLASLWPGKPAVQRQPPLSQSTYQQALDAGLKPSRALQPSDVRYWSDYSRVYYHPKSLVQLYDFELGSSIMPFERFETGAELFESLDKEDEIVDRDWRPFVEECDQMQGVQVFASLDDAWGGFAASYVERLRDEHPKSCIWVWGVQSPVAGVAREKRRMRLANTALSLNAACGQASMVVPLGVPDARIPAGVAVDGGSPWHVSALLATAAESASLQSRLRLDGGSSRPLGLSDMAECLNVSGRQTLANMRLGVGPRAVDARERPEMDLSQIASLKDGGRLGSGSERAFGRLSSVRRPEGSGDEPGDVTMVEQRPVIGSSIVRNHHTSLLYPLLDSFPSIYDYDLQGRESIPVHTSLASDGSIVHKMRNLRTQVAPSISLEERENLVNGLAELGAAYEDEWSSGSDSGDDDL